MKQKFIQYIANISKTDKGNDNKSMDQKPPDKEPANFETAISATGFGLFNYLLLLVGIPCCFASLFSTTSVSFILPSAECDLQLTLMDKGTLNGATYAGMISSAILWGYLSDTLGRRKLMIYGYLFDAVIVLLCALSQNVWSLMVFKFLSGFIICGPFAVLMSYLTEFHGADHRARVIMTTGVIFSIGSFILPLIAWSVITKPWTIYIGDILILRSWQIFIAICSLPSLIAGTLMILLPESPKFLMSQGHNEEALNVFRKIYRINNRNNSNEYSIHVLADEHSQTIQNQIKSNRKNGTSTSSWNAFQNALLQITPLFRNPLWKKSALVFTIQFCELMGVNTLRLWLPEIFAILSGQKDLIDEDTGLCGMIARNVNKSSTSSELEVNSCENLVVSDGVYMYTIFVGLVSLVNYFITIAVTNVCGPKYILVFGLVIAGSLGISLYWAKSLLVTFILSSLYVSIGSICSTALVSIVVNIFPTTLRTMTVSLLMMFGRTGSLIGNILFPYLLSFGCFQPFGLLGLMFIAYCAYFYRRPLTSRFSKR